MKLICLKYFLTFIVVFPLFLSAQEFKADLIKMGEAYSNVDNYATSLDIKGYDTDGILTYNSSINLVKSGELILQKTDMYTMVANERYTIMILPEEKELTFRARSKNEEDQHKKFYKDYDVNAQLDSMFSIYSEVIFLGNNNGQIAYKVFMENNYITEASIYIDQQTFLVGAVEYIYRTDLGLTVTKVIMDYEYSYNLSPSEQKVFNTEQYFVRRGKEYFPSDKYKEYSVSNNLVTNE